MANYQRSRKLKFVARFASGKSRESLGAWKFSCLANEARKRVLFYFYKSKTFGEADKTFQHLSF